jgi:MFS family permease
MGAVDALLWVACSVALAEIVRDEQLEAAYAAQRAANAAAYTVAPLLAAALILVGFGWVFGAAAAASCLTALLAWRWLPDGIMVSDRADQPAGSWRSTVADRRFAALFAAATLAYLAFFGIETVLPVALVASHDVSPAAFGLLFAINPLITTFAQLPLTARVATVPIRARLVGGTLIMGCPPLLLLGGSNAALVAVVLGLFTLGELVWAPSASAFAARTAPPYARGTHLGALAAAYSVGFALAPAAGFSARSVGGNAALWACLAASAAVAALLYAALTHRRCTASDSQQPTPANAAA